MLLRSWLDRRTGQRRTLAIEALRIRPWVTVAIGAVGGLIVGMTSVGSGSLMIVLLLFAYPALSAGQLVGHRPHPGGAADRRRRARRAGLRARAVRGDGGAGDRQSVPAVLVGSLLSSRAPDKYIRPVITFVIFASGLKYAGLGTTALGWTLCLVLLACGGYWLVRNKPWQADRKPEAEPEQPLPADILNR